MIVITTPTGLIGHQVLENILDRGQPIRVIVRDPSRLPSHTLGRIEVFQGSHGDIDTVNRAFAGADAVFWLVPPDPQAESVEAAYVDFTRPATEALQSQGVKRVVGVSALGRGTVMARNAGFVTASLKMDELIASTGAGYRALTMPSFMDNILRQVGAIKSQGMFFSPISGDRKLPSVATRDIATVAAKLLLDPSWSGNGSVPVMGPEDLSFNDMAQIMSEVLGKSMARGMLDMAMAKNEGLDNAEPRTRESTTPTTFRQWCEEVLKPAVLAPVR
jgi:uncharacterized protein YbjT (DUF2867 family)